MRASLRIAAPAWSPGPRTLIVPPSAVHASRGPCSQKSLTPRVVPRPRVRPSFRRLDLETDVGPRGNEVTHHPSLLCDLGSIHRRSNGSGRTRRHPARLLLNKIRVRPRPRTTPILCHGHIERSCNSRSRWHLVCSGTDKKISTTKSFAHHGLLILAADKGTNACPGVPTSWGQEPRPRGCKCRPRRGTDVSFFELFSDLAQSLVSLGLVRVLRFE